MNQAIEDYLAGLFTSAQLTPAPEVFTGTSSEIRTPESHAILVLADSIENVVGPLHRATVKILVSSPTDNRMQHATLAHREHGMQST
jgi:outer membrane PBP1 activator LpoA protein